MIEFDNILDELNRMTRPQWIQLLLLILPCLIVPPHMGGMVYLAAEQPHTCEMTLKEELEKSCGQNWTEEQTNKYIPWNDKTNTSDSCTVYSYDELNCDTWWPNMTYDLNTTTQANSSVKKCNSWSYDTSLFTSTVVNEFDLVCDAKYQRRLAQAIFMLGVAIGCTFWGQMSDRFGRKIGIVGPLAAGLLFAVGTAFVQSFILFTVLRFFVGFNLFPAFSSSFVLGMETVKPRYRVWVGQSAQAFFALGFCLLALLGLYIRDWRTLQLAMSLPIAAVILILWFIFESPRWLISSKKYIAAEKVVKKIISSGQNLYSHEADKLEKIAQRQKKYQNGEDDFEISELNKDIEANSGNTDLEVSNKIYSVIDLLRYPNMRKKTLILFYEWMVTSSMYYGLTLNAADLGGDPFMNLFLSGIVEVPASYLAIVLLEKWGRRPTLVFTMWFGGIACISMMFVPKDLLWLNITLSMLGKFSIAAAFGAVYIYAAEIYPTPVRNLGLGVCSSWARIGGILSPFIAMLDTVAKPLPYVVFGLMSTLGGFLTLFLPEVMGIKLPETLEESEAFGKDQISPLARLCCRKTQTQCHNKDEYANMMDSTTTDALKTKESFTDLDRNI